MSLSRDIAQIVIRWLSTGAARVRDRVKSCGNFGSQVSSEYFGLPGQFFH
jgi:hypothetical protein